MSKPEVWLVNHYAITPDLPGGTRHYDMAVELVKRGYSVKVFASDFSVPLRSHMRLEPNQRYTVEDVNGVQFVWLRTVDYSANNWRRTMNMLSFGWSFLRVGAALSKQNRPTVIIGSSPHPIAALVAQLLARKVGARFLLELRDLWPQALVDMGGLSEWHPGVVALRLLESYLYRQASRIITLASGSTQYLKEHGVNSDRVLFLPNGVHFGHFQPTRSREESRKAYGFTKFTVVYAGAHGPANALETIIHAARLLRHQPVELVLVGDGPAKERLLRMAEEDLPPTLRFLPPVPKGEVPNLLNAADAGVITLRNVKAFEYGVSPNKLFDYMAAGLPLICSVPGDMATLVREAAAGIVCPAENAESLASAVEHLSKTALEDRNAMGARGTDYVFQHYQREALVDQLHLALDGSR